MRSIIIAVIGIVVAFAFGSTRAQVTRTVISSSSPGLAVGVPSGFSILGTTATSPVGYNFTGVIDLASRWDIRASAPTSRSLPAIAAAGGKVYAIGGSTTNPSVYYQTNEEYDPAADSWTAKAAMPTPRVAAVSATVGNSIFVIGGANGTHLRTNEMYDSKTDAWSTRTPMPTARALAGAEVADDAVYVFGGTVDSSPYYSNAVEKYDPSADTWETRTPMPTARWGPAVAALNGKIYVIGGRVDAPDYVTTVNEVYDPTTDAWETKAPMPIASNGFGLSLNGKIYVFIWSDPLKGLSYDPRTDSWGSALPQGPASVPQGAVALNGSCYVPGWSGSALTNQNFSPRSLFYVHTKE